MNKLSCNSFGPLEESLFKAGTPRGDQISLSPTNWVHRTGVVFLNLIVSVEIQLMKFNSNELTTTATATAAGSVWFSLVQFGSNNGGKSFQRKCIEMPKKGIAGHCIRSSATGRTRRTPKKATKLDTVDREQLLLLLLLLQPPEGGGPPSSFTTFTASSFTFYLHFRGRGRGGRH